MEPYPLPFLIDRTRSPRLRLENRSEERLRGVMVLPTGRGLVAVPVVGSMEPRSALEFRVVGESLELDTALIVRWLRPDGSEWLWRVAL